MKLKSALAVAALAAATAIAGQAAAAQDPAPAGSKQNDCFYSRNIRGFAAVDDETLNIEVGSRNNVYQLKLFAPSNDLKFANGLALISHGGSFICSSLDATLVVPGPAGPQRYPVTAIRHLTPDEVKLIPKKQRP